MSRHAMAMRLLAHLRPSQVQRLESAAQLAQGKGWGTATTDAEAAAVATLLQWRSSESPVVLDVGANAGDWTRAILREVPNCLVHAFEPSLAAFGQLEIAFGSDDRVSLHRHALGRAVTRTTLYADTPGSGLASLTKRRLGHHGLELSVEETVDVLTLDEWVTRTRVQRVDALKMDVEGHELDVLRGAEATLPGVSVVQFEFGGCNIDTRTYFQDFWYLLTEAGFKLFRLGPSGLSQIDSYSERDEVFMTTNFFAARQQH